MKLSGEATRDWNSYLRQSLRATALNYNIFYKYQGLLPEKLWLGTLEKIQLKTEPVFFAKCHCMFFVFVLIQKGTMPRTSQVGELQLSPTLENGDFHLLRWVIIGRSNIMSYAATPAFPEKLLKPILRPWQSKEPGQFPVCDQRLALHDCILSCSFS